MCLTVERGSASVAKTDIDVYKVVVVCFDRPDEWQPPFMGGRVKYPFGETLSESGMDESGMNVAPDGCVNVEGGFFHSTGYGSEALMMEEHVDYMNGLMNAAPFICRARIPAGTRYYTDGTNYASERIVVESPWTENENASKNKLHVSFC